MQTDSSTGLSSRTASVMSYLGWWVTGLIFWGLERRDPIVRFHAVQATVAFGALVAMMAILGILALLMLSFAPRLFTILLWCVVALWVAGIVLWVLALWHASQGKPWRIPLAAKLADTFATTSSSSSS